MLQSYLVGGLVLLSLGVWASLNHVARHRRGVQVTSLLAGLWFVVAPLTVARDAPPPMVWTTLAGGAAVALGSLWVLVTVTETPPESTSLGPTR